MLLDFSAIKPAFPTAVGMNRHAIGFFCHQTRVPHSRGDEPSKEIMQIVEWARSPQPWG